MDRLDAMAAFVAVAELRGFAPAARRLGLSPSAITRLVAALEERLSIRLLQRTTRSVTLTDAGARYLARARRILVDVGEAEDAAQAERTVPTGRFVVTAPVLFGRLKVMPLLGAFLARYPAVSGELTLSDGLANMVEEGIDVAVRIGNLEDSSLFVRKVGDTRRVVIASPKYLAKHTKPSALRDIGRDAHRIIQCTSLDTAPSWLMTTGDREERVGFAPTFVTNSADVAIAHAIAGGGLARVLAYQVADDVRAGTLKVVLADFEPPPLPIHLVYPTTRQLSAKVRAFVELTTTTCDWTFVEL